MSQTDPRVDAYIAKAPEFAKPILTYLRETVHSACPGVEETIKWRVPHFMYKGMLGGMSAFKEHCVFGFWKGTLVVGDAPRSGEAAGQLGRITAKSDLPPRTTLVGWIRKAAALNDQGIAVPRAPKAPKAPLRVPAELAAALKKNAAARRAFDDFSPSHKREYIEWITEAKTDATRTRRIATAIEWVAEGKSRNWKYERR
jgi:uncharacterized protein YdeI (YjbR/CyaY-like superfamily)